MTKLTLELPEDLADRLADTARRRGRTLEEEARASLAAHYPPSPEPAESRAAVLERMRERWKEIPPIDVSPEQMKTWINEGRP